MSSASLSEIYGRTEGAEPQPAEAETPDTEPEVEAKGPEESEAQPAEEEVAEGKPESDESGAEEEAVDDKKPTRVPLGELLEERKKRQELERRVSELQGQTQVYEKISQDKGEKDTPESLEDQFYKSPVQFLQKQVAVERMNISEFYARKNHPDYDQVMSAFQEYAQANPAVWDRVWNHPAPAELAYEQGKVFMETKEFGGSLDSLKERLRKEVREEVLKEIKGNGAKEAASKVTKSNADARGIADAKAPKWSGPPSVEEIYSKRR